MGHWINYYYYQLLLHPLETKEEQKKEGYTSLFSSDRTNTLTPYKEAPALKVSRKARAANVVYPPAEPPVMQRRSPSTLPLSTCHINQIVVS